MREKYIQGIEKGTVITDFFLIKDIAIKETRGGQPFATFTITDRTGEIPCKKWDLDSFGLDLFGEMLVAGDIVKIRGTVDEYNGSLQMIVDKIRPVNYDDEKQYELADMIKTAPIAPEDMYDFLIQTMVNEIDDSDYRNLCQYLYDANKEEILYWPAAKKVHHAHMGGFLWHTYRMTKTALALSKTYSGINKSLLLAGTILHDIGKLREMNSNEYGIVSEYSAQGELLGHLVIGVMMIADAARMVNADMNEEKLLLLQHMLASHHGNDPEMGSAHKPCLLESYILHEIDMIDMYAYIAEEELPKIGFGEMTPPIFALGKSKLYRADLEEE